MKKITSCLIATIFVATTTMSAQATLTGLSLPTRYYDAAQGRFISADTVVPDAKDPQSLNRYAYVRNNPIIYSDPDGHFAFLVPIIAGAVVGAIGTGMQSNWNSTQMWRGALVGGVSGFAGAGVSGLVGGGINGAVVGGMVAGGTAGGMSAAYNHENILNGMAMGMVTGAIGGAAFGVIGNYYGNNWTMGRVVLQGATGGGLAEIQGGKFSHGFVLAGGSALAMKGHQAARNWTVQSQLKGTRPTIYNKWGEPIVAGTRDSSGPTNSSGWELDLMEPHDANPNRLGPIRYDVNSELGRFINQVGAVHDVWNGWNYGANGNVMPGNIGFQTAFGIWSAVGMPPATVYTAFALSAETYQPYIRLDRR